jgi:peroxiredoxin
MKEPVTEAPMPLSALTDHRVMQLMRTQDHEKGTAAMLSLYTDVCDYDPKKFDEACRLIDIFMTEVERSCRILS